MSQEFEGFWEKDQSKQSLQRFICYIRAFIFLSFQQVSSFHDIYFIRFMEKSNDTDLHFQKFTKSLKYQIEQQSLPEENFDDLIRLKVQKEEVEKLVSLEKKVKEVLLASPYGESFYNQFIDFICHTEKNILLARPYFRERQISFYKGISDCFKNREWKGLTSYHFNFLFISFFESPQNQWKMIPEALPLIQQIKELRKRITQKLMPLAISRSRIFCGRTPKSHLDFMDLLQISAEGLISAIDKYCLPFTRVFRSVCIGRMVGNFIAEYSETFMHFYPVDRRKIYRANKITKNLMNDSEEIDYRILAQKVNKTQTGLLLPKEQRTTPEEIYHLLAASSCVSTDMVFDVGDENEENCSNQYAAPLEDCPDVIVEKEELFKKVISRINRLTLLQKKLLILEGLLSYEIVDSPSSTYVN